MHSKSKLPLTRRSKGADSWRPSPQSRAGSPDTLPLVAVRTSDGIIQAAAGITSLNNDHRFTSDDEQMLRICSSSFDERSRDYVDCPPTDPAQASYSYFDIFLGLFSIISYLFDVGSDVYVAVIYYREEQWWWFGLTVAFIVVPSLTITGFSLAWYIQDRGKDNEGVLKNNRVLWVSRSMLLCLQLGPVLR
jgi:hypothetical protein